MSEDIPLDRVMSGQSWEEFCDTLKAAGQVIIADGSPENPLDRAEGFRYLSRLTRAALENFLEFADPLAPVLHRPVHETAKIGADNPDNLYQKAVLNGALDYRLSGTRGSVYYLSFTTSKGSYAGDSSQQLETGFLDSKTLTVNDDRHLSTELSR